MQPERSRQLPEDSALRVLEAQLDGFWRGGLTTLGGAWRARRVHFARLERGEASPAACLAAPAPDASALAEALAQALNEGAYVTAVELGRKLGPRLDELRAGEALRAREAVLHSLLLAGERAQAATLASAEGQRLARSASGASLLELLGMGNDAPFLPDGRPNFLCVARRIDAGALTGAELARLLGAGPRLWLRHPELHLLFFMSLRAGEPRRARAWLNRFLSAHGLPPYAVPENCSPCDDWLSALRPVSLARYRTGPLVSVVVPVRNAAATLRFSVRSLLEQTHQRLELLLGDDASTDDSLLIMRELAAQDARVRVFCSTRNQGSYNLRNALTGQARGEILTFHDADDLALPTRVELQLARLLETQATACVSSMVRLTPSGSVAFHVNQRATRLCLVSLMLRTEAFRRFGPFRSVRVGGDLELYQDLVARAGSRGVTRVRAPLTLVSRRPGSVTRSANTEALEDGYRSPLRREYCELIHAKHTPGAALTDEQIAARLRSSDNHVEPARIEECDPSR